MADSPLCGSCAENFGFRTSTPSADCRAQRFFAHVNCNHDADTGDLRPGVYWRPNKFRTWVANYNSLLGGTVPAVGDYRDLALTIAAPAGCGTPVDDLSLVAVATVSADILADGGQFNSTFDMAISAGPPVFPNFPVSLQRALAFGNHTDNSFQVRQAFVIPAGQSRTVTVRWRHDAGAAGWDGIEMELLVFGDYLGV